MRQSIYEKMDEWKHEKQETGIRTIGTYVVGKQSMLCDICFHYITDEYMWTFDWRTDYRDHLYVCKYCCPERDDVARRITHGIFDNRS